MWTLVWLWDKEATGELSSECPVFRYERFFISRKTEPTLVYRRTRADMIETYKLLHGKYYGEFSNLAKLQTDHVLRDGTTGRGGIA